MTIKIRLSLSNNLFSEGIKRLLDDADFDATFAKENPSFRASDADIVLFDTKHNISALISAHPQAKFILLDTGLKDLDLTCLLLCHHINGIIQQDAVLENLTKALKVVYEGDIWIDQKHLKTLIKKGKSLPEGGGVKGLSEQDKRIIEFIAQGYKNVEIAEVLCLSEPTIKAHISRIYRMLKVKNRAQLACLAHENDVQEL